MHGAINILGLAKRTGTQIWSFYYVDDLIEGFMRLMHMPADFIGPVSLDNSSEFSMIELAEHVKALTGSRSELIHNRYRPATPSSASVSVSPERCTPIRKY